MPGRPKEQQGPPAEKNVLTCLSEPHRVVGPWTLNSFLRYAHSDGGAL